MAFGRRIVGDEAYNARQLATKGKAGFGHRVTGATAPAKAPAFARPPAVKAETPIGVSLEEMDRALGENTLMFDPLFEQELARPEGPRIEALRVLRAHATGDAAVDIDNMLADAAASLPVPLETSGVVGSIGTRAGGDPAGTAPASETARPYSQAELDDLSFADLKELGIAHGVYDPKTMKSRASINAALLAAGLIAPNAPETPAEPESTETPDTPPAPVTE